MLSKYEKNDEHHIRSHIVSALDVKKITLRFTVGH